MTWSNLTKASNLEGTSRTYPEVATQARCECVCHDEPCRFVQNDESCAGKTGRELYWVGKSHGEIGGNVQRHADKL